MTLKIKCQPCGHEFELPSDTETIPDLCPVCLPESLIIAAPDLLAACQRMLREIEDISVGAEEDMAAAVAKAEGREINFNSYWASKRS